MAKRCGSGHAACGRLRADDRLIPRLMWSVADTGAPRARTVLTSGRFSYGCRNTARLGYGNEVALAEPGNVTCAARCGTVVSGMVRERGASVVPVAERLEALSTNRCGVAGCTVALVGCVRLNARWARRWSEQTDNSEFTSLTLGGLNMAHQDDIALMAHLMRRAGFGASRDELEARVAKGYDATVEELLNPETQPPVDPYTLLRHQPAALLPGGQPPMGNVNYMYYLVNTKRPLEEKMALFWHQRVRHRQLEGRQLRPAAGADRAVPQARHGQLPRPAADDREEPDDDLLAGQQPEPRHGGERELGPRAAELFSLGAGNYTEVDVARHRAPSPAGPSRPSCRACPTAASRGSSSIARKTTTTARRRSSATRATSTARTSSTSSCSSRRARSSSAGTCTTSSSPTSRRCRPGRSRRRAIRQAIDDADEGVPANRSAT